MMTNKTKRKIDNWVTNPNFNEILDKWVESNIKMYSKNYFYVADIMEYLNRINNVFGLKHEIWMFISTSRIMCNINFRINNTNCLYAADKIIEIYGKEFLYGLCVNGLKPVLMKKKMNRINDDFN